MAHHKLKSPVHLITALLVRDDMCSVLVSCPITFIHVFIVGQRFGLHDDSSKKMSSLPASLASCAREESQLQLAKVQSNPMHCWNPSIANTR
ncbi:hypothetical protein DAI22_07g074350 [Oryza sativa Japonica Group]|nr:hypothetical protein DAI22_07g074350 [Oryza sativa Japonica Group]